MTLSKNEFVRNNFNLLLLKDKFKYSFDPSTRILYKDYFGTVSLEEIYHSWDFAITNNVIPNDTIGFILDYRKATFDFEIKLYGKIAEYYENHLQIFGGKKIGIISENPRDVAVLMLFKSKENGYLTKPFFTLEGAIEWVTSNL